MANDIRKKLQRLRFIVLLGSVPSIVFQVYHLVTASSFLWGVFHVVVAFFNGLMVVWATTALIRSQWVHWKNPAACDVLISKRSKWVRGLLMDGFLRTTDVSTDVTCPLCKRQEGYPKTRWELI